MNLQHELEVAKALALEAGHRLRSFHRERLILAKNRMSWEIVTIPDLVADDVIVSGLKSAFPEDAVCSEQSPSCWDRFECNRLWLVDALDGVESFAHQGDECAVSIGLTIDGTAVLGVVYNPIRDELYSGSIGQPIEINGLSMSSFSEDPLPPRISVPHSEWGEIFECVPELLSLSETKSISYELARVAAGMHDGFFTLRQMREWNTCAGIALVSAAGHFASMLDASEVIYNNEELRHTSGIISARTYPYQLAIENILHLPAISAIAENLRRRGRRAA